jgi:hypothetical protein
MRQRPQRDRRRRLRTWALRGGALVVVFAIGLALGQTLDDASPPAGTSTSVRTLVPATLGPETITVTVSTNP